jgi:nitrate/nitrite transport system substrate-binding protein
MRTTYASAYICVKEYRDRAVRPAGGSGAEHRHGHGDDTEHEIRQHQLAYGVHRRTGPRPVLGRHRDEKKDLKVGFIPITCATPIIMAHPMGFYAKHGLNVEVVKTAGWAVIRDKTLNKEYDAAHMLSPMPLAISLGVGSNPDPLDDAGGREHQRPGHHAGMKHKDKRDPKSWKGFKFAVPFDYSMHNYLLRYYLAEHGIDPDTDVQIRSVPPPEMVANLRADNIDGFLAPDPVNQRAVYRRRRLHPHAVKDIWDGHPCCAFAASKEFVTRCRTPTALLRAIIDATAYASKAENRKQIAEAIAPATT